MGRVLDGQIKDEYDYEAETEWGQELLELARADAAVWLSMPAVVATHANSAQTHNLILTSTPAANGPLNLYQITQDQTSADTE
ncbi:hypothetical protein SRHO_G00314640 [Serrasalmus rhombeus]